MVTYLQNAHQQSVGASALYLSLFFGLVMLGRFLGSFFVEQVGYLRSILIATLGATLCIALGAFGSASLAFFLPLAGFFLSIIFPTITAAVSDIRPENTATILGLLFTFAGVGGMLGPWLIGLASDALGITLGFGVNLIYCILLLLAILILMKETRHDGQKT
jgi:FHS family glucose/mannose:H+ symporter-like MFS transporter